MGREVLSFDEERAADVVKIIRAGISANVNVIDKEFLDILREWCDEMTQYYFYNPSE